MTRNREDKSMGQPCARPGPRLAHFLSRVRHTTLASYSCLVCTVPVAS